MQPHPLELPEVLALIGTFLLCVEEPQYHQPTHRLDPKAISACLRVSKLWYKTLLPVLWHIFSSQTSMHCIPPAVIRRDSHFCRILEVPSYSPDKVDLSLFTCTHLVEATLFHAECRQGAGNDTSGRGREEREVDGQQPQQQLMKALSSGQRLLRSNPRLRILDWSGAGIPSPPLDVDDFAGLKELHTLSLLGWDCSNGQLRRLLKIVAGSLKELKLDWIKGVQPEELSTALSPSKEGEDTGVADGNDAGWALSQLKVLEWFNLHSDGSCLTSLVKRCPNLKSFKLRLDLDETNATRLANSLWTHCPNLEALIVTTMSPVPYLQPLIRCGPTPSVLRKLRITSQGPDCGLIAAILHHASTLEDISIVREHGTRMDAIGYCRLLFECPRLTYFSLYTQRSNFNQDFMDALKEQHWACLGLQELRFSIATSDEDRRLKEEREIMEDDSVVLRKMGWEYANSNELRQDESLARQVLSAKLWRALEMIQSQGLEQLCLLQLDSVNYRRISSTPS